MGLFSSLFGKKEDTTDNSKNAVSSKTSNSSANNPSLHLRGKADSNGLYPSELVMLAVAEKYKTTETKFPGYLTHTYEVTNPQKMLKDLQSRGFIDIGNAKDILPNYKVSELKEFASSLGVEVKGKKDDIISQLSEIEEDKLSTVVKERTWKLTDSGHVALEANPYIQYFLDNHPYDVTVVGVNIWTVNEDFVKNPKRPYRDIIYRQLNEKENEASIAIQKNPGSGSYNTYNYCECYRLMGLFIEEEGKSYVNASDLYFQYIYKNINIHESLKLLISYKLFKNDKKQQQEAINRFCEETQLYPFQRDELLRLIDELGIEQTAVRDAMITSFKRADDKGIMTEEETADFIILELSGEGDKARDLAQRLAKKALKKI